MKFAFSQLLFLSISSGVSLPLSADTVQLNVRPLFNARVVTTLTEGQLVTWRDALDGVTSGEATLAAAEKMGQPFTQALPDDGVFPATERNPRVELGFSNADGRGNQVRLSLGTDDYTIDAPRRAYRQLWIFVMSGNGESHLHITLSYADGAKTERALVVPDWYFSAPAADPRRINLATDIGKWSRENRLMERDHHYLHGLDLQPDPARELIAVSIQKEAAAALTLWGVTGVTP